MTQAQTSASIPVRVENCFVCARREGRIFCRLSGEALRDLMSTREIRFYPAGTALFAEGETACGVYILCSGLAKLVTSTQEGRSLILRLAGSGEALGLSSVMANDCHSATAEAVEPSQVSFIPRADFLRLLRRHREVATCVAEQLSADLREAWGQARLLGLAEKAEVRLAHFLIACADKDGQDGARGVRLPLNLTRQEIGEAIGTSRETVSRLLSDLRRRGLIRIEGGSVIILQPDKLRGLAGS